MKTSEFSQARFEEALIAKLVTIHYNGVGLHKNRSQSRAMGHARIELSKKGYSESLASEIVNGCRQMAELEIICDKNEEAE